jgi:hypothetical protein
LLSDRFCRLHRFPLGTSQISRSFTQYFVKKWPS